jgi:hypothetical protein
MRSSIRAVATLVLSVWPVATARADGLGRAGYEALASIGISLVIGGLALSLAMILGGIMLVRGRWYHPWPAGVWRPIGFLALFGVMVTVGGPILTAWFGLTIAMVIVGVALFLVVILGGFWLVRQHQRKGGRIRQEEMGPGG